MDMSTGTCPMRHVLRDMPPKTCTLASARAAPLRSRAAAPAQAEQREQAPGGAGRGAVRLARAPVVGPVRGRAVAVAAAVAGLAGRVGLAGARVGARVGIAVAVAVGLAGAGDRKSVV